MDRTPRSPAYTSVYVCEEEDTCVSYEEEDTCVSYEEEDTWLIDDKWILLVNGRGPSPKCSSR
jgi:hypothetical protein